MGLAQHASLVACACRLSVSGTIAAHVFARVVQRTVGAQKIQHPVPVFFGDFLIEQLPG